MAKTVVIGASSGLGRCIGVGLAERGDQVALLARRRERIENAAKEAGRDAVAIECDVTEEASVRAAISAAADGLGGIDNLVYTPAIGSLMRARRHRRRNLGPGVRHQRHRRRHRDGSGRFRS